MAYAGRDEVSSVRFRTAAAAKSPQADNIHEDEMHLATKGGAEERRGGGSSGAAASSLPRESLSRHSNGHAAEADDAFPLGITTQALGVPAASEDLADEDSGDEVETRRERDANSTHALLDAESSEGVDNWVVVNGEGEHSQSQPRRNSGSHPAVRRESSIAIAIQVFVPYLVAGFGMVGAGLVLDLVQHWNVFRTVSQIFIMVPALLGLKGNLEMTLASRLSTQANMGTMDRPRELWSMAVANIVLTQAQAIVVGFLVSVAAATLGWILSGTFDAKSSVLLGASAVLTSSLASLLLGAVMILVIILSRKCSINPDNVATPVAASLGDLTTLCLLAVISSSFFKLADTSLWVLYAILMAFLAVTPIWIYIARRNPYTRVVVCDGWVPVISAMLISSLGGMILEKSVAQFPGLAAFQPVINGVGGNLAAIQASRLSTALHQIYQQPGRIHLGARRSSAAYPLHSLDDNDEDDETPEETLKLPPPDDGIVLRHSACPNPLNTFFSHQMHSRTARVLLVMAIPGHLIFMYTIYFMNGGNETIHVLFIIAYMIAAMLQIIVLLYITHWLVQLLWKRGKDPDNFAIPYLTAIGDILGTALLAAAFHILSAIGDSEAEVGE